MISPNFDLILNLADPNASGRLVLDGSRVVEGTRKPGKLIRNDAGMARIRACLPSQSGGDRAFDDVDLSAATVRMALGAVDKVPSTGTFPLAPVAPQTVGPLVATKRYLITNFVAGDSFLNVGATANATGNIFTATGTTPTTWTNGSAVQEITTDLAVDATYTQVQTALNATAAITALGGVTVTRPVVGTYQVTFTGSYGARVDIVGPINANMAPLSVVSVSTVQVGTATLHEVQLIRLIANPYCFATLSTPFPVAASAVTVLQAATQDLPATKRLTLDPIPYAGTVLVTVDSKTFEAPYNATEAQMQSFLPARRYIVTHRASNQWEFSGVDPTQDVALSADVSHLIVPIGVTGNMPLNTVGMHQEFSATTAKVIRLLLEVEIQFPGQDAQKFYQEIHEVHRDLISSAALVTAAMMQAIIITSIADTLIYNRNITALRGGAFSLEAVDTTALTVDTVYVILINGYPQTWILRTGAADVDDPTGEVAPTNYHATTNNKHWEMSGW